MQETTQTNAKLFNGCIIADDKLKDILLYSKMWKLYTSLTIDLTTRHFGDYKVQLGSVLHKEYDYALLMYINQQNRI